ncbi:[NiFe]-hydrogenase assembly chaperone HybE [Halomonas sp. S2151]|uniref:[NiFe]-hydrogenase assembly chaperone HybE n=1 Tax=Halomonas sp. S2151 TaxID=579478 RepID=UPI0008DC65E7|nr:[NiFe]-hydrogenase assembly chaperone HybE [Halomonas sp. S2151]
MTARFEGSFLGDLARLDDDARLECKICWYCYDPAVGDAVRQVEPGTPFSALPQDWRCPQCDGERNQFMVLDDRQGVGGAVATPAGAATADMGAVKRLVETFREIQTTGMKDSPFNNLSLHVEAVGFIPWEGGLLGILVAPWLMNLVVIPGPDDDAQRLRPGDKRVYSFASGDYEFIFNTRVPVGAFLACSLFSDMSEFASQAYATEVARAAMEALFDPAHRAETDRHADIAALSVAGEAGIAGADADAVAKSTAAPSADPVPLGSDGEAGVSQWSPPAPGLESRRDFLTGRRSSAAAGTKASPSSGAPLDSVSGDEDESS